MQPSTWLWFSEATFQIGQRHAIVNVIGPVKFFSHRRTGSIAGSDLRIGARLNVSGRGALILPELPQEAWNRAAWTRVGQLGPHSLAVQSVGALIGSPSLIAGKLP